MLISRISLTAVAVLLAVLAESSVLLAVAGLPWLIAALLISELAVLIGGTFCPESAGALGSVSLGSGFGIVYFFIAVSVF